MYVSPNFKAKKFLKDAVNRYNEGISKSPVTVYSPGPFPCPQNGKVTVEGPHYPEPHKWYAVVEVENGIVKSVR